MKKPKLTKTPFKIALPLKLLSDALQSLTRHGVNSKTAQTQTSCVSQSIKTISFSLSALRLNAAKNVYSINCFRRICLAILGTTLCITPTLRAVVNLPLEITSPNGLPQQKTATVIVPSAAEYLYLQIHNLRYGGQVSVRLNGNSWVRVYNDTVIIDSYQRDQGGIGGINSTIKFKIKLTPSQVLVGQSNNVEIRLNETNGIVNSIRVIDLDFLNAAEGRLLAQNQRTKEDPNTWTQIAGADKAIGENLWNNAVLKDNIIENNTIRGKCASCHFQDGSDLKYFNFSNESIISRARFHGLSSLQGQQIASYIRSSTKPNPGNPWDPPFQPGPGLDPRPSDSAAVKAKKVREWMAGAGLENVLTDSSAVIQQVFPNGTSASEIAEVIDHNGKFSVRQIAVPYQFPDWNAWLPHYAPEDVWPSDGSPKTFLNNLKTALSSASAVDNLAANGSLITTFDRFNDDLEDWYGQFRLQEANFPANDTTVSKARAPGLSREDAIKALVRWMVVKIMENVRAYDIEGKHDNINVMRTTKGHPKFDPDPLLIPGDVKLSGVFSLAPHIIANNWSHFEGQPEWLGKMESNQWYHLSLCLNSASRMQANDNVPLDWDYQLIHLQEASERSGIQYGIQNLITQIKMYQSRDNGAGVTIKGFSPRFLTPWKLYSDQSLDRSLFKGALDDAKPGLWRKTYEQFLYEYLDVMESMDLSDTSMVPRRALVSGSTTELVPNVRHNLEASAYRPVAWPGGDSRYFEHPGEIYADLMFRLLPLLPKEEIDIMLLQDLHAFCKRVWTHSSWNNLNITDSNTLYSQNFETGASDFTLVTTLTNIKNANFRNIESFETRGGGGKRVAERTLTADSVRTGVREGTINLPSGTRRLKLRARTAFKDDDGSNPGAVKFKMQLRFNNSNTLVDAPEHNLSAALYGKKFQSYEASLIVPSGATSINQIVVHWNRVGGAGGGVVYLDNVHVLSANIVSDDIAPGAPTLLRVTSEMIVTWSAPTIRNTDVLGYNVYRKLDEPGSTRVKINTGLVDNPYLRFNDYAFAQGKTYIYDITAVDTSGNESTPSNTIERATVDADRPEPPKQVWVGNVTNGVQVRWFPSEGWDVASYVVQRKRQSDTNFTSLSTTTALSYLDGTVAPPITYQYRVIARDINGNTSVASPVVSITTQ